MQKSETCLKIYTVMKMYIKFSTLENSQPRDFGSYCSLAGARSFMLDRIKYQIGIENSDLSKLYSGHNQHRLVWYRGNSQNNRMGDAKSRTARLMDGRAGSACARAGGHSANSTGYHKWPK